MPTKIVLLASLLLIMTGCSASSPSTPEIKTPNQSVSTSANNGSLFAIDEVGLGANGYVALTNFTDQPVSMGGLFLCQGKQCFELPQVEVVPGATARVAVGEGAGLGEIVATRAAIGELRPADGELVLSSSRNVKDPKAMLVYLEWGSTPHASTQSAIDAGLWIKGSFAPSSDKATRLFRDKGGLWLFETR